MIPSAPERGSVDSGLIRRLQSGETEAFAELYDRYSGLIYGLILRMVRNPAVAEDILQEVFLKVWRSASTLDAEAPSPGPWLIVVARRHTLDYLRSGQNQRELRSGPLGEHDPPSQLSLAEADFELEERGQLIRNGLARLESRQRQVLELAYFEGLTQTEMAEALGQPLGTVKSWVRVALKNLKKVLQKENF